MVEWSRRETEDEGDSIETLEVTGVKTNLGGGAETGATIATSTAKARVARMRKSWRGTSKS